MFTEWVHNFGLLIEDTYGESELPFASPTYNDLRQKFEAGFSEREALTQFAGEWVETEE